MKSTEGGGRARSPWIAILAFVIAYIASRAIFAAIGFRYRIFQESFDPGKLMIDFGVWAVLFGAALWGLSRLVHRS